MRGTVALLRHGDGEVELTKMAVDPAVRGAGIGRKLMAGALDAFAQMGGSQLFLETNTRLVPAIKLYESVDFVTSRRRVWVRTTSGRTCTWSGSRTLRLNPATSGIARYQLEYQDDADASALRVSANQRSVVELGLVGEHMRVGVGGHGEIALADELGDPRPRDAPQMQQPDPPVTQIVR